MTMRTMMQEDFEKSGMRIVEGDHDYDTNPQGRHTYDNHYGTGSKSVFDTVRGVKRSVSMRYKGYDDDYCANRVAVIYPAIRKNIDWATGQEIGEPEQIGWRAAVVVVE
jgi:hypothetical protein